MPITNVSKVDIKTIEVTEIDIPIQTVTRYDFGLLQNELEDLIARKADSIAAFDAKIAKIQDLLSQATKIGVTGTLAVPSIIQDPIDTTIVVPGS